MSSSGSPLTVAPPDRLALWCSVSFRLRPSLTPRAFARSRPSLVRAPIQSRSNSALCGEPHNAEFERDILRDRVKAGIAQARSEGKPHGRTKTAARLAPEMRRLRKQGLSKRAIAKRLFVSRTSVIRLLRPQKRA